MTRKQGLRTPWVRLAAISDSAVNISWPAARRLGSGTRVLLAGLALAALTLLVARTPSYDPTAWLIWGRELTDGTLNTLGGPSWKPLPVVFTALVAPLGDSVAPALLLLITRASGVVALALAFVLARRFGGTVAGVLAAAGLGLATGFMWNCLRGDSEGFLVAFVLGGVLLHLDGRRRAAFALFLLAGGLRPEVWPVLAAYGLWLARAERSLLTLAAVATAGVALAVAWFLPDYLSNGNWLQSADRAIYPVPGTPAQSAFPFGVTFLLAAAFLPWPLYAGAAYALARDRRTELVWLAGAAAVLMVTVAILAEFGFTGNIRYATLPGALLAIVGGVGLPPLVARLRGLWRALFAFGTVAAVAVSLVLLGGRAAAQVTEQRVVGDGLDRAIAAAGGADAVRACAPVTVTEYERQAVAYHLDIPPRTVATRTVERGIAFVRRGKTLTGGVGDLPIIATTPDWTVHARC